MAKKKAKPGLRIVWVPSNRSRVCRPGEEIRKYDPNDPPQEALDFHAAEGAARAKALGRV